MAIRNPVAFQTVRTIWNMNSTTNLSLLLKLKSKTEATAWSHFVKLYAPLVHRWVGEIGIKEPDRSDVSQDVFVVLLGKMTTFQYDPKKSFRGWLRTITLNKCRDLLRVRRSKTEAVVFERIERATLDDSELLTETEYRNHLANAALKLMREHFSETTWRACWAHVVDVNSIPLSTYLRIPNELNDDKTVLGIAALNANKFHSLAMGNLFFKIRPSSPA